MTNAADEPGHGRYDLLAKLGEGPRGPRFVARRAGSVAADPWFELELSAFATGEDELLRTFVRDAERATRLAHRNVLGIVDLGTTAAGRFVVTEHVADATLSELQARDAATRRPRVVLAAVIDALHGLHAAHTLCIDGVAQALIHGGIDPGRLRIGLDGVCRISGFGHARPRVQTRPSHRTQSAAGYMAPEQLTGAEFDHRADLFAIGIVLWNALTGKKLFHDRIEHLTMSNVLERRIPRPSLVGLSPPPALDAAVVKALERDPDRRYQTAAEMAAALRDVARGAACLAPASEVSEWVTSAFGGELAARHRTIEQLASQPRPPDAELSMLPPLGRPARAETAAREELSIEELTRAVTGAPAIAAPAAPADRPRTRAPARKQLAILTIAAFAVVAVVLGWRTSHADDDVAPEPAAAPGSQPAPASQAPPAPRIALEVTVLDVHRIAPVVRAPPPDPAPADPAPPRVTATRAPEPTRSASPPARPVVRPKKPGPSRGTEPAESPAPRPAETRAESAPPPVAPPPKPEPPPRQTMDSNPYIYNK
jgi:serine/threonine-protein kinase